MGELDRIINDFVEAIKATEEYQEFEEEKEKFRQWPELKAQVDEYRVQNFCLQQITDEGRLLDEMERFEKKYEKLLEDKRVNNFLERELAFCRMMQYVNHGIMESLEFE